MKITPEEVEKFKLNIATSLKFEIYKNQIDLAQTVNGLKEIEAEGELQKMDARIAEIKTALESIGPKKVDRPWKQKLETELRGTEFLRNKLFDERRKMFLEVNESARKIEALGKEIEYTLGFDHENLPQLDFVEIDGTKYAAKDNQVVLDAEGARVLYVTTPAVEAK